MSLTPALRAALRRCDRTALTVLTTSAGRPWTPDGLANSMALALKRLGIPHRLHGLRRSAALQLARQGLSSLQIARQLGWSESEAEAMSALYVDAEALNANAV
jgi:integrase